MMRKGITYEEVENAANYLIKNGQNPTIERVRHYLGTGSAGTINRFLNQFKDNLKSNSKKKNKDYRAGYQDALKDMIKVISKLKN